MPEKQARPVLKKLSKRIRIDKSIRPFINRLRKADYDTFGCCSAMKDDHSKRKPGSTYAGVGIKLPKKAVNSGKKVILNRNDFIDKQVYDAFKQIGRNSGWNVHFFRRLTDHQPTVQIIFAPSKNKQNDKRIIKAWQGLTINLEKSHVYKKYSSESS